MPVFDLFLEQSLGISHNGEVVTDGDGTVELSEEQVRQLVDLIRENGGETDVNALGLKEKYPIIYELLDNAYRAVAQKAEYDYWVIAGYENGGYETPEEESIEKCEQEYGFKFEFDEAKYREENGYSPDQEIEDYLIEEAKQEAFYDWVEEYRSKHYGDDEVNFLSDVFDIVPNVDDVEYIVEIPKEILEMAKKL